jgi:hypothetical protein
MKTFLKAFLLCLLITVGGMPSLATATCAAGVQSCSSSFQVDQTFFGAGGELEAHSNNFKAKQAAGEISAGETCSDSYCAHGGYNTDRNAYLEFVVNNTSLDLGTLTASGTKTTYATFTVKAYQSHGYAVYNASPPPTNGSYQLATPSSPVASSAGTEQFGLNLAANTSFGATPEQLPDDTFSSGQATSNYNQPNLYMYAYSGADSEVAFCNTSSGTTRYTVSYIFNISHVTPGGTYVMNHVLVATATF